MAKTLKVLAIMGAAVISFGSVSLLATELASGNNPLKAESSSHSYTVTNNTTTVTSASNAVGYGNNQSTETTIEAQSSTSNTSVILMKGSINTAEVANNATNAPKMEIKNGSHLYDVQYTSCGSPKVAGGYLDLYVIGLTSFTVNSTYAYIAWSPLSGSESEGVWTYVEGTKSSFTTTGDTHTYSISGVENIHGVRIYVDPTKDGTNGGIISVVLNWTC